MISVTIQGMVVGQLPLEFYTIYHLVFFFVSWIYAVNGLEWLLNHTEQATTPVQCY